MGQRKISELFFELRAKTEGLQADLNTSQRQLGKWADFVKANPTASALALGAAMLSIGLKAIEAADKTDGAIRQISANLPKGTANAKELRGAIAGIATEAGVMKDTVIDAAKEIARLGVSGTDELKQRLAAVQLLVDATGVQTSTAVQGLDQVMDLFGLDANRAIEVLAKLAQTARGKTDIDSLFGAFQAAAPRVRELGLSVDDTTKAIVKLLDEGKNSKQVAKFLNEHDANDIRAFAKDVHLSADAMKELNDRANEIRAGADRVSQSIKNQLGQAFEELGHRLQPARDTVYEILTGLVQIAAHGSLTDLLTLGSPGGFAGALGRATGKQLAASTLPPKLTITHTAPSEAQLSGFPGAPKAAGGSESFLTTDEKKKLRDDLDAARKAVQDFAQSTDKLLAGGTKSAVDNALTELEQFRQKFVSIESDIQQKIAALPAKGGAGGARAELQQQLAQLGGELAAGIEARLQEIDRLGRTEAESLRATIGKELGTLTGALAEQGYAAIKQQNDALRDQVTLSTTLSEKEKLRLLDSVKMIEALQHQKDVAGDAVRSVDDVLKNVDLAGPTADSFTALNDLGIRLHALQLQLIQDGKTEGGLTADQVRQSEGYKLLQEALLKIAQERARLAGKLVETQKDITNSTREELQAAADRARALHEAVDGALQLAGAMGLVDERGLSVLRSIGQVATQIPNLVSQLRALGKTDDKGNPLATLGSVVGAALPIAGGIASLISALGESPAEKQRRQTLQENTAAIRELTKHASSLAVSGSDFASGAALVRAIVNGDIGKLVKKEFPGGGGVDFVAATAEQIKQLQDFAKSLGLTFDGTVESLQQLAKAAAAAGVELGRVGNGYSSESAFYQGLSSILGLTDEAKFRTQAKAGADASPLLASLLGGADLSTAAGIEALKKALQDAYLRTSPDSKNPLTSDELGGLNVDQFDQAIQQWIQELNSLPSAVASASDKLKAALTGADQALELADKTSPIDRLQAHAKAYEDLGGALGDFLKQFDLTTPDGIAKMDAALGDFLTRLKANPEAFDLAGLSIDDLTAALLELDSSADAVASSIANAAQKIAEAEGMISTSDTILGTDATGHAQELGKLYGVDVGTLESKAQRDAIVQSIRDMFVALDKNDPNYSERSREFATLVQALNAIAYDDTAANAPAADASTSAGSGVREAITNTARGLTEVTGDILTDLWRTADVRLAKLVELGVANLDVQNRMLAGLLRPVITGPLLPPVLPNGFGQPASTSTASTSAASDSGIVNNIRATFTIALSRDDLFDPSAKAAAEKMGEAAADAFDKRMWDKIRQTQRRAGSTAVPTPNS